MREEVEPWAAGTSQPSYPVNAVRAARSRTSHQKHSVDTQKRVRHVVEVWGTRRRFITAAMRYPKAYPCWRTPDPRPRASIGRFSSAVDEARPQTPPIAIPKKDRRARNCLKVFTYPEPSSKTAQKSKLKTRGHFRPKRSERTPKMI